MLRINRGIWTMGIPIVFSVLSVVKQSLVLFLLFIVAHFIILGIAPAFRHRESLWMFIIVAISSIPVNIYLIDIMTEWDLIYGSFAILLIAKCVLAYISLLSIEEIIMGVITRCIWKRQYKDIM